MAVDTGNYRGGEVVEELKQYLEQLKADLDVEIDLHGGRTRLAFDLRQAIIATEIELEERGGR